MKIESKLVTQLTITDVKNLDPIRVFMEDLGPNQGRLIIECYGKSWSTYWGSMGGTLAEFIRDVNVGYIVGKISNIESEIFNPDGIKEHVKKEILSDRRNWNIGPETARELWDAIDLEYVYESLEANVGLMSKVFGEEWFHCVPMKPNPDYIYLERIVTAVKEAVEKMQQPETIS